MKITENTKALSQAVYDYIIMNPEKHDQETWFAVDEEALAEVNETNFCDTTMCIAGTAVFLTGGLEALNKVKGHEWYKVASPLFGLDPNIEAEMLFAEFDNSRALDLLNALAHGDEKKFLEIKWAGEDEED